MKIMAFVGSPRNKSNVDILIDSVLDGARSVSEADIDKIYLYGADIKNCTGCLACTALKGCKECPLQDEMPSILNKMVEADAFVFGSPNHCHTISSGLTNLFCRMQPLLKMNIIKDTEGNIVGADSHSLIDAKKAIMVVSQGDFSPSASALILRILDSNFRDFKLKKAGEVFSMGNLEKGQVIHKKEELQAAFEAGKKLLPQP